MGMRRAIFAPRAARGKAPGPVGRGLRELSAESTTSISADAEVVVSSSSIQVTSMVPDSTALGLNDK